MKKDLKISEDDTFRALKKPSYNEMKVICAQNFRMSMMDFEKYGWKYEDYMELLLDECANLMIENLNGRRNK